MAIEQGFESFALTVRYGQRHAVEVERATAMARALGARQHRVVDLDLGFVGGSALTDPAIDVPKARSHDQIESGIPSTYVPARNTVFLSLALAWAEGLGACDLFLGVNAVDYSGYPDCRPEFIEAFETLANRATKFGVETRSFQGPCAVAEMDQGADRAGGRSVWGSTRAGRCPATTPGRRVGPCGQCDSCVLRAKGFREAGLVDPAV